MQTHLSSWGNDTVICKCLPHVSTMQGRIQDLKFWGALKKIAPSGGRREKFWGISCEKSRLYAKKSYFFQFQGGGGARRVRPPLDPPLKCHPLHITSTTVIIKMVKIQNIMHGMYLILNKTYIIQWTYIFLLHINEIFMQITVFNCCFSQIVEYNGH